MKRTVWLALCTLFCAIPALAAAPAAPPLDAGADLAPLFLTPDELLAVDGPGSGCNVAAADPAAATQGPVRVGEAVPFTRSSPPVRFLPKSAGGGPALIWSEEIQFPEASYIAPHFARLDLPAGAHLVVRSPDGSRAFSYAGRGKAGLGVGEGFWGVHVPGDTAIVELYSTVPVAEDAVRLDSFARGYAAYEAIEPGPEAICGADDSDWAKCYQSSEATIYDKSRAVLRLLIQGTSACTGWMVGSEGHVITNNHCISSSSAALNTDYEVMAEGATCGTNCTGFGSCPGTVIATSGTLVRTNSPLDYTLIRLPTNPTGTYGFFQMRSTGPVLEERIYIPGHPGAWGKRFAVASSHSSDGSGFCEVWSLSTAGCTGGPGDTGYFCDTQGGSSGSPVVAYSDHAVVSLHHCANCPNRGVPIGAVISDLGADLPADAVVGGEPPPPPPPPPPCSDKGASCSLDSDCCSGKCNGKSGSKTCK